MEGELSQLAVDLARHGIQLDMMTKRPDVATKLSTSDLEEIEAHFDKCGKVIESIMGFCRGE